ncbi:hypothetical protein HG530_003787 [Fusarium avenaceum]|nr:hypothetical protein HG530_003787 [Fusarium avenaceum]
MSLLRCLVYSGSVDVPTGGSLGDAGVVWNWVERDVDLFVGGLGAETVRVDQQQRPARRIPSCYLYCEEICAISYNLHNKLALVGAAVLSICGQLDTQRTTARPAKTATTTVEPRSRDGGSDVVVYEASVGDSLDSPDCVLRAHITELLAEMSSTECVIRERFRCLLDSGQLVLVDLRALLLCLCCVGLELAGVFLLVQRRRDLLDCRQCISLVACVGLDVVGRHLLLQGVNINMEDLCILARLATRLHPGNIAVQDDDGVSSGNSFVNAKRQTDPSRVICWEAHVATTCIQHPKSLHFVRQFDKSSRNLVVSSTVACHQ